MRLHTLRPLLCAALLLLVGSAAHAQNGLPYPIVDTNQTHCFSAEAVITCGSSYDGQDGQYAGLQPAYQHNGDGTVTDLNTGLMWISDPGEKTTYAAANQTLQGYSFAGYTDWRLPTIKELYSLTLFNGFDPSAELAEADLRPFMDTDFFVFRYGDESQGERQIDAQWLTSTVYNSTVMGGSQCFFGFNFADGRIKCYPLEPRSGGYFAMFVRGDGSYGQNAFVDNGNGTITDNATGLTWAQADNGAGINWGEALAYCEALTLGGADDWRLPSIKELQSIVDYSRSPDATGSAAIDPLFSVTAITNEGGQTDYPHFWSSTTHIGGVEPANNAAYVAFGRALGNMDQFGGWVDVHGAGAQRSDPKLTVSANEVNGFGPQGDARRANNFARCVRGGDVMRVAGDDPSTLTLPIATGAQGQGQPGQGQGQPGQGQPPQEAFAACTGLPTGAACTVNTPQGTVNGTCQMPPTASNLACVPNP